MGWISPEQADLFYTPASIGPEDRLESEESKETEAELPEGDSG